MCLLARFPGRTIKFGFFGRGELTASSVGIGKFLAGRSLCFFVGKHCYCMGVSFGREYLIAWF